MPLPTDDKIDDFAIQLCNRAKGLLMILDRDRNIVVFGPGTDESLGYSAKEVEGASFDPMITSESEDALKAALEEVAINDGLTKTVDLSMITKDGQNKVFQALVFSLTGPDGDIVFGLRGQDITRYVEMQRSVELMNKKLSILGSATRHDVLNSLTGLFGFLELAECKCKEDPVKKYIQKAKISAETIKKQIEFTRDYQELGSKRPSWINVEECLRIASAAISEPRIPMEVDVGGLKVFADPMLEKVFYNLIDNAQRHSGAKMIRVRFEERGDIGALIFEDDGRGIPPEEKDIIFARGYGRNSGLGLHLVREVFDITGISIKEDGEPGKGARFVIMVPKGKFEQ